MAIFATLAAVALAATPAQARVDSVFGGLIACKTQPDGVRFCQGDVSHLVSSWDGAPIDVNVTLPPVPARGDDGNFPLIGIYHGWGGSKVGLSTSGPWARRGYAVFTMSDRGWGDSCGGQSQSRVSDAQACAQHGYNHLMDTRYEVRDAQTLIGRLADQKTSDGTDLVNRLRIGATGGSYGGGMSMALAALRDRIMLPDGTLVPWRTPTTHRGMRIAAAAPEIPWTDLAYSLMPNGRNLDYAVSRDGYGSRIGVQKASFVAGLFATGAATSNYALPQQDPGADLYSWYAETTAGEPYDQNPLTPQVVQEIESHHSSYYIDPSEPPAPLLISNGFTDDLFPVDEDIRFYNRTKLLYPRSFVGLEWLDYGHQRGQNKAVDVAVLHARQQAFFDYFLKGDGPAPFGGVQALAEVCGAPGGQPSPAYSASDPRTLVPGEVRLDSAAQQVVASGGDPQAGRAFDPITGGGACATASDSDFPGTAVYRLPVRDGFTLLGGGTIVADITSPSPTNQLAARLLDVAPGGSETLVARGLYRPDVTTSATRQLFQLHPGGWRFAPGHVLKLELLTSDAPYARPSNGQSPVLVSNLELRLPAHEQPGSNPQVVAPAAKIVPPGYTPARDWR